MNLELYIAKRILSKKSDSKNISRPIVRIAILGISIGLCIMILSIAIVTGFKKEISDKVTGFGSNIQITHFDNNTSFETIPIILTDSIKEEIKKINGVKHTQYFATKPGILKTKEEIQGIILHGTGSDFDSEFIENNLVEGSFYSVSDSVKSEYCVISQNIARNLKLSTGDKITVWFIQQPPRVRRFTISGIYNTGLQEFDNTFAFCDIKHIQKLNDWSDNQYSGLEVYLNDINLTDVTYPNIRLISSKFSDENQVLRAKSIKSKYPYIFDWLDILDVNVWIILSLMIAVAGFNMVSGLLILILEKTNMIGVLKALGQKDFNIRKIFLYLSIRLVSKGLLWGNIAGLLLCFIQKYGQIIKLDPVSYYISTVPININLIHIIFLNIGTLFITVLMLVVPSIIISKINPTKAIKFE